MNRLFYMSMIFIITPPVILINIIMAGDFSFDNIAINKITIFWGILGMAYITLGFFSLMKLNRWQKYVSVMDNKDEVSMDELILITNVSFNTLSKDINRMIKQKILDDAYIDLNRRMLVLHRQTNSQESRDQNSAVEIQPCPSCGATNSLQAHQKGKCEYCGSVLTPCYNKK